jgi:hypothetical protein
VKRAFQDFVNKLEKTFRDEERAKKQELQRKVDDLSVFLKAAFEKLGVEGILTPTCRWKDWVNRPEVTENTYYQQIEVLVGGGDKEKGEHSERDRAEKSDSITAGMANSSRNVFEDAVDAVKVSYKQDRRLIKDVLEEKNYIIEHDSTYEAYSAVLIAAAGVRAVPAADPALEGQDKDKDKDDSAKSRSEKIEEKSDKKRDKDIQSLLWDMLDNRPKYPLLYFTEVHDDALEVFEQARERQKRKEDKYITLLEDFYNRSDHVGIQWEDAKQEIGKYPEYTNLARNDRKRIFTEYMAELEGIMKLKTKSLHDSMLGEVEKIRAEDKDKDETPPEESLKRSVEKDEKDRDRDRDTDGGEKRDSKRHRSDTDKDRDRDHNRDREYRGRERGKEDDDRDKDRDRDRDRDQKGRDKDKDKDKHRSDREVEDRKRGRDRDDREDEEGEEDEDDEGDDEDGKKGKKHKKSKSSRDKAEKDKKHKKVRTDYDEAFLPF